MISIKIDGQIMDGIDNLSRLYGSTEQGPLELLKSHIVNDNGELWLKVSNEQSNAVVLLLLAVIFAQTDLINEMKDKLEDLTIATKEMFSYSNRKLS